MIKTLLVILLLTAASFGQKPTPMPPTLSEGQRSVAMESTEKQQVDETILSAKVSTPIYAKCESDRYINLSLISSRTQQNQSDSSKIVVKFDLLEHLQQATNDQVSVIENAVLIIDDKEILFPMAKEATPNNSPQFWQFQIMLSPEETIQLRNATKISVKWNKGSFDVDPNDLEKAKKFVDDEMPNLKVEQVSRISEYKVIGDNFFSSFLDLFS